MHQAFDELGQRTGQRRIESADLGIGLDTGIGRAGATGVPQQHAAHPEDPRVLLAGRPQSQSVTVALVQSPAHARSFDPLTQLRQVGFGQAEAARQRRDVQQIAHLALLAALLGQAQQPVERHQQRVDAAILDIANLERNIARVVAVDLSEHGADGGGKDFDVGHHDHHIARAQRCGIACRK